MEKKKNLYIDSQIDYLVDQKQRTVFDHDQEIILTNKEFTLLLYLIENKNTVVTREQILRSSVGCKLFWIGSRCR